MKKKHFKMGEGFYYFNIKAGQQSILIKRASKDDALRTYHNYLKVGKECEWLGCWNGKKFDESNVNALAAATA